MVLTRLDISSRLYPARRRASILSYTYQINNYFKIVRWYCFFFSSVTTKIKAVRGEGSTQRSNKRFELRVHECLGDVTPEGGAGAEETAAPAAAIATEGGGGGAERTGGDRGEDSETSDIPRAVEEESTEISQRVKRQAYTQHKKSTNQQTAAACHCFSSQETLFV